MNFKLWFKFFSIQCLFLSGLVGLLLVFSYVYYDWDRVMTLLQTQVWHYPLYIIMLASIITLSIAFATLFTLDVARPFDSINARLNWLVQGQYHQPIFDQEIPSSQQIQSLYLINHAILTLRDQLGHLSSELQEYTAGPTFVGEHTEEEIIERERHRIARELHDSVSQQLFAATMLISTLNQMSQRDGLEIADQVQLIEQTIGMAQTEMRALLLHLRPIDLADHKLEVGIENLLKELQTKVPMKIHWNLGETQLESGIEDHLFRIVQEAISNAMRHAKATQLEVFLEQTHGLLTLKISDNGVGFIVEEGLNKGNYGLRNMSERVKSMGGQFQIKTALNQGTVIEIKLMVTERKTKDDQSIISG